MLFYLLLYYFFINYFIIYHLSLLFIYYLCFFELILGEVSAGRDSPKKKILRNKRSALNLGTHTIALTFFVNSRDHAVRGHAEDI